MGYRSFPMNMETTQGVFDRYKKEYIKAKATAKGGRKLLTAIVDTVCEETGMHRKAAIRKFRRLRCRCIVAEETRGRPAVYLPDVTAALKEVWEAGGEVCGELLHPMIREYVLIFRRDKTWKHREEPTEKLCAMSEGTVKARVGAFMKLRRKGKGRSATSPSALKHIIPIFHGDWSLKPPGTGQLDTVAHCGHSLIGDILYSLNYTDIPTLWLLLSAQWNKGQEVTRESLGNIKERLPWTLREIHPDTGTEFINWNLKGWCDTNSIAMTRSRPNHKNDNPHVEERNGHIVRKWIGYMRFDCREAVDALNDVYSVLCPYLNHFVASRRVIEKVEIDGKWKKKYEKVAKTPYQRVLEHPDIATEVKEKLRLEHAKLNPAVMRKEVERLKAVLYDVQRKHGNPQNMSRK